MIGVARLIGGLILPCAFLAAEQAYDVLILNGRLIDGTGAPAQVLDVGVRGDRIAAVGNLGRASARLRIDADGLVVAPGFIDIHTHALPGILAWPVAENYIRQGVTTLMEGQDGQSPLPLGPFLDELESKPRAVNLGFFVGHGAVRAAVLGLVSRAPTGAELERMRGLVDRAMREGAFGISTGLLYVPGCYAKTDEIVALAQTVARLGGIYISHIRDEAAGVLDAVREALEVGEKARIPVQITHCKLIGPRVWGRARDIYRAIDQARRRGLDVTVDQYPYTASSTATSVLVPRWAFAGGREAFSKRLDDRLQRQAMLREIEDRLRYDRGGGDLNRVVLANCFSQPEFNGMTLAQALGAAGRPMNLAQAAELILELEQHGGCVAIYHAMAEADVEEILRWPFTMVASDGTVPPSRRGLIHPRSYGTFARVLGYYVRERRLLSLEEAVRKMTALPAMRLGLRDRGLLRSGMIADIVVFDPARIRDRASYADPHRFADGVQHVLVNGQPVLLHGTLTGALPGRVLRGPAYAGGSVSRRLGRPLKASRR